MPIHAVGVHTYAVPHKVFEHLLRHVVLHDADVGVSHFVDGAVDVVRLAEEFPVNVNPVRVALLAPLIQENPLAVNSTFIPSFRFMRLYVLICDTILHYEESLCNVYFVNSRKSIVSDIFVLDSSSRPCYNK